jgi:hypothetical protein
MMQLHLMGPPAPSETFWGCEAHIVCFRFCNVYETEPVRAAAFVVVQIGKRKLKVDTTLAEQAQVPSL